MNESEADMVLREIAMKHNAVYIGRVATGVNAVRVYFSVATDQKKLLSHTARAISESCRRRLPVHILYEVDFGQKVGCDIPLEIVESMLEGMK